MLSDVRRLTDPSEPIWLWSASLTAMPEAEVEQALAEHRKLLGASLVLILLPHDCTSAAFDQLALSAGAAEAPDTLVACPCKPNLSGAGYRLVALAASVPQGWSGGDLQAHRF